MKQSGAAWSTRVDDPVSLDAFVEQSPAGARWLAEVTGRPAPPVAGNDRITVVIGPEGGLTEAERERVLAAGYDPIQLATHTLRFETAAVAAAAAAIAGRLRGSHG